MDDGKIKFIADVMLGRTARWLRLFGYDTIYNPDVEDFDILFTALIEGRILLTRDVQLARTGGSVTYLVRANNLWKQLQEITNHFSILPEISLQICPVCNGKISPAEKVKIQDSVPRYTYLTHQKFWRCEKCGKIYWKGSHLQLAREDIISHILKRDSDNEN